MNFQCTRIAFGFAPIALAESSVLNLLRTRFFNFSCILSNTSDAGHYKCRSPFQKNFSSAPFITRLHPCDTQRQIFQTDFRCANLLLTRQCAQSKGNLNVKKRPALHRRNGSTKNVDNEKLKELAPKKENGDIPEVGVSTEEVKDRTLPPPQSEGLIARFKQTYRQHGKIFIGVHLFTSTIWAGSFYYIASTGFDVMPLLHWFGCSEETIARFSAPGLGYAAIAYLMYKLATPIRYPVTIGGTQLVVKFLRKRGDMPVIAEKNKLRSMMKEGRVDMRSRMHKMIKEGRVNMRLRMNKRFRRNGLKKK